MTTLTARQRAALVALGAGDRLRAGELAGLLDTSTEGAAMTASSLVRRGLATRAQVRPTRFAITAKGLDHLRAEQLELAP